jgi:hypothetical protein
MNDAVEIALVGFAVATVPSLSAVAMTYVTWRLKRADRIEDYKRQDAIAKQVREAASLLITSNEHVSAQNSETQGRLKEIHTLVNSNLTNEMRERLIAVSAQVALTKEVQRLNAANGLVVDPDSVAALLNLENIVASLSRALDERTVAAITADAEKRDDHRTPDG